MQNCIRNNAQLYIVYTRICIHQLTVFCDYVLCCSIGTQFRYNERDEYNSPQAKRLLLAAPRGSISVELVREMPRSAPVNRIMRRVPAGNVLELRTTAAHPAGAQRLVFLSYAEPTSEDWLAALRAAIDAYVT